MMQIAGTGLFINEYSNRKFRLRWSIFWNANC